MRRGFIWKMQEGKRRNKKGRRDGIRDKEIIIGKRRKDGRKGGNNSRKDKD